MFADDVTRLLLEINTAWKVKAEPDPTILPKGKSKARKFMDELTANLDNGSRAPKAATPETASRNSEYVPYNLFFPVSFKEIVQRTFQEKQQQQQDPFISGFGSSFIVFLFSYTLYLISTLD
ncbi:hypothetical protein K1719_045223 [Acacia pycnantha]|nr:hypothetical protein K1719_045223 [Acacia pycnantha]